MVLWCFDALAPPSSLIIVGEMPTAPLLITLCAPGKTSLPRMKPFLFSGLRTEGRAYRLHAGKKAEKISLAEAAAIRDRMLGNRLELEGAVQATPAAPSGSGGAPNPQHASHGTRRE